MKYRKPPQRTSRAQEYIQDEAGELNRLKRMVAAAVKVFWLKRGSRNEGRDIYGCDLLRLRRNHRPDSTCTLLRP